MNNYHILTPEERGLLSELDRVRTENDRLRAENEQLRGKVRALVNDLLVLEGQLLEEGEVCGKENEQETVPTLPDSGTPSREEDPQSSH